jgi:hypothetical protein
LKLYSDSQYLKRYRSGFTRLLDYFTQHFDGMDGMDGMEHDKMNYK